MKSSRTSRKLKKKVWLLYLVTFALIGGIVTLFISNAQSSVVHNLTVSGTTPSTVSLSWDASPAAQNGGYKIYRNNSPVATSPTNTYTDTGLTQNVSYKYKVSAFRNGGGETDQSQAVNATPMDNSPAVSITAPAANSTHKGTVALSANATDDVAVASVQFQVDNANVGAADTTAPYSIDWDTTTASSAKHNLTATVTDNAGHKTTSQKVVVTVDNTKPTVSFQSPVANAQVSGAAVTVQANASDNDSVAGVTFQVDGQNIAAEVKSKPYKITWNATTVSNGNHTLTAIARDTVGNTNTASITVAVSGGTATDTTAPQVNITAPTTNNVSGTVNVTATASDNVGVSKVTFYVMNLVTKPPATILNEDTSSPYGFSWDTTKHPNGKYRLTATARDGAGNNKSDSVDMTINNGSGGGGDTTAPTVSITAPNNNASVSGNAVRVQATAKDNIGVTGVQLKLDGNNLGSEITKSPYRTNLDATDLAAGNHSLTAIARDAASNSTTSATVTIKVVATVDKTGPVITDLKPSNNSFVKGGTVDVSATVTDNVGVAGVQFKIDNTNLGSELTSAPYKTSWQSTAGNHTLSITARDGTGNKTTQSAKFTIDSTAPTITFTAPANNSTVSGNKVKLSVNVNDNGKVASVEYKLNVAGQICKPTKTPFTCSWNTTTLANGARSITAIATDGAGNTASATVNVTVSNSGSITDKLPPSVPGDLAGTANQTSISLSWTASTDNQDGSGVAGYIVYRDGKDIAHTSSPAYVNTGLTAGKTYTYKVSAYDNGGNESKQSKSVSVKAGGSSTGNKPPTVLFVLPEDNSDVRGTVNLTAVASDDGSVASVVFKQNNEVIGTVTTAPYTVDWDTTKLGAKTGNFTVTATATDDTNLISTATIKLKVDNSIPTLVIKSPKDNAHVSSKVNISATASDNSNLSVQFLLDGNPIGQTIKSGNNKYSVDWYSNNYAVGKHVISATATDLAGNTVSASEVTVNSDKRVCTDAEAPDKPNNLRVQSSTTRIINLGWGKVNKDKGCAGLAGYAIFRDGDLVGIVNGTKFTDKGLTIGTGYRYTISTIDRAGNVSSKTDELAAATKQRAGAVKGDVDYDLHVNGRDLSIVLTNFKKPHDKIGDANLDGQIDGADLSVVLTNFGN